MLLTAAVLFLLAPAHANAGPTIPWTWQIAEVFRIEKGLIVAVESVLHPVPYGMGSGWSTWEEAMSSLPRTR